MISICTVLNGFSKDYYNYFLQSLKQNSKHEMEFIVVESPKQKFGLDFLGHAIGLFECQSKCSGEYIMFSDPDIYVFSDIISLYINLIKEYDLNYVGISHHSPEFQPYRTFPTVFNMLMRRQDLPPLDFMKEDYSEVGHPRKIKINGNWILPGKTAGTENKFTNPNAKIWDTGNRLELFCNENKKRWLSFGTKDDHLYTTDLIHNNFNAEISLPHQKIVFHEGSSSFKPFAESKIAKLQCIPI